MGRVYISIFLHYLFLVILSSSLFAQKTEEQVFKANSVLSSGNWYKISVSRTGIYKIDYNDLITYGINPSNINPLNLKLYGNGGVMLSEKNSDPFTDDLQENSIWIHGEDDGTFDPDDYILFYGQGTGKWNYDSINDYFSFKKNLYSDYSYYFINISNGNGKRIKQIAQNTNSEISVNKFTDYIHYEKDSINLIKSGKEWFGEVLKTDIPSRISFNLPNIVSGSIIKLKTSVAARNTIATKFLITSVSLQDTLIVNPISGNYTQDYARISEKLSEFVSNENTPVDIEIKMLTSGSSGWINFLEINGKRKLLFSGNQLSFRNTETIGKGKTTRFVFDYGFLGKRIWNVTDPFNIHENQISFFLNEPCIYEKTETLQEFIAFDALGCFKPTFIAEIPNQNLHAQLPEKLIIITPAAFMDQALRLASLHELHDQINSVIATTEEIYNEFSSGIQDISAIRNFIRMLYHKVSSDEKKPKYVLLMGDGSYIYKNYQTKNNNIVPTFQSENSLSPTLSHLSDDFFGLMDQNEGLNCFGHLDLGIGRFPCTTHSEVKAVVDKIEFYMRKDFILDGQKTCVAFIDTIPGNWKNSLCFIADDEDNNMHVSQANELATFVDTTFKNFNINKIYIDAFKQVSNSSGQTYPEVNQLINNHVQNGALWINYTGHGGEDSWASEGILGFSDIYKWNNRLTLPVFITATCEFSRFDDPSRYSAGELIFNKSGGGGIALLTTTRLAFSNSNFMLNKSICKFAFSRDSLGKYNRLGDIIRLSKVENNSNQNIKNFVLFGDPALKLSLPENNVVTANINEKNLATLSDTVKAGELISVSGIIEDFEGNALNNFNGILYPVVFDQKEEQSTLANDQNNKPFYFNTQDRVLYKGKISVNKGTFNFSFLIPRDIVPKKGQLKISYFAKDDNKEACGYYESKSLIINGENHNAYSDNTGPEIQLYMNNLQFINKGTTDPNPLLLIHLNDSSGINAYNIGFGHEITAVLDNQTGSKIILNDYYKPSLNNRNSGWVLYPFNGLTFGTHNLSIKAWDIMNNSSEATIEFNVASPNDINISKTLAYPNPLKDKTNFYFEHNQPCCEIDVTVDIFDMNGKILRTLQKKIESGISGTAVVEWDGSSENSTAVSNGIYIFKIKSIASDGSYAERAGKIIVFR